MTHHLTKLSNSGQEDNSKNLQFSGWFSRFCQALGITKTGEIATFCKVSPSLVSDWKAGRAYPRPEVLLKAANCGRTTIDWILTGDDPKELNTKEKLSNSPSAQQDFFTRVIEAFSNQSVESIAKQLGLTPPGLYRWRNINTLPNGSTLVEIYKKTGVSIHWLLFGQGAKYPDSESFGDQMTPLEEFNLPEETRILSFYRELPEEVRRVVDIQIEALWENFSDCQEDQEVPVPVTETTMEVPPNENRRSQPDSSTFNQGSLRRKAQ